MERWESQQQNQPWRPVSVSTSFALSFPPVPMSLCTVMSQAKESFSLPGIKVWVPHTRRVINHQHEVGFCNRTGVKDPLAVTPSRLVYFFQRSICRGVGVSFCAYVCFPPGWGRATTPQAWDDWDPPEAILGAHVQDLCPGSQEGETTI